MCVVKCSGRPSRSISAFHRTLEETLTLICGVEDCGGGKWADIKKRKYKSIENRSAVSSKAYLWFS